MAGMVAITVGTVAITEGSVAITEGIMGGTMVDGGILGLQ
jgi:tetrahydrodipicolinate N-succinyltransferase